MKLKSSIACIAGAFLAVPLMGGAALAEKMEAEKAQAEEVAAVAEEAEEAEVKGSVARSAFTSSVVDREPQDDLKSLPNDHELVYFFTELADMAGEKVTHRWEYNGQVMAEVSFDVGGDRWRTHSTKNLQPIWLGEWTVTVVDANENVLSTHKLDYMAADAAAPAAPAAAAPAASEE